MQEWTDVASQRTRPASRPPWRAFLVAFVIWIALAFLAFAARADAQVTADAEIREGVGRVTVANPRSGATEVQVQLWEAREVDEGAVELLEPADADVWPRRFPLDVGGRQRVFLMLHDSAQYEPGTLLRLVTVFEPPEGEGRVVHTTGEGAEGVDARLRVRFRLISKVWVRGR